MNSFLNSMLGQLLVTVLTWTVSAAAIVGVVSLTPLGKAFLGHLLDRQRDSELLASALDELAALRASVDEVLERLDVTERRLAAERQSSLSLPLKAPSETNRVVTPH